MGQKLRPTYSSLGPGLSRLGTSVNVHFCKQFGPIQCRLHTNWTSFIKPQTIHIDDGGSYVHKELKLSKSYTPGGLLYFCAECECSSAVRGGEWGEISPLPLSHPCAAHFLSRPPQISSYKFENPVIAHTTYKHKHQHDNSANTDTLVCTDQVNLMVASQTGSKFKQRNFNCNIYFNFSHRTLRLCLNQVSTGIL